MACTFIKIYGNEFGLNLYNPLWLFTEKARWLFQGKSCGFTGEGTVVVECDLKYLRNLSIFQSHGIFTSNYDVTTSKNS